MLLSSSFSFIFFSPFPLFSVSTTHMVRWKNINEEFGHWSSRHSSFIDFYERQVTQFLLDLIPSFVQQMFVENLPQALFYWGFQGKENIRSSCSCG